MATESSSAAGVPEKRAVVSKEDSKEEVCDDWEQLDPQKIEKSLQSIKLNTQNATVQSEEKNFTNLNSTSQSVNSTTSQAPAPSFKILKRPQSNKNLLDSSNPSQNTSTQNVKTYEQRQEEYAQARLRILGSAHPEEAPVQNTTIRHSQSNSSFNQISSVDSASSSLTSSSQPYANKTYAVNSGQRGGGGGGGNTNTNAPFMRYQQQQSSEFNVTREPIGPDGSQGFGGGARPNGANFNPKNNGNYKNFVSK